jgi:RNA polymerase sigma-70 factor (ECF subfamily)
MSPEDTGTGAPAHAGASRWFATTRWSVVRAAADAGTRAHGAALEQLCTDYWYPLYAYARRCGSGPEDAEDLTQGFFHRLLLGGLLGDADRSRGRFRSFLLGAFKHHLSDERDKQRAAKRGGRAVIIPLGTGVAESRLTNELRVGQSPDQLYDRSWALLVLERAVQRVREDYHEAGKGEHFDTLKSFLWGEIDAGTYRDLAGRLGATEAAMKMAVSRLRRQCREALRREVIQTVANPDETEEEVRFLVSVLRS